MKIHQLAALSVLVAGCGTTLAQGFVRTALPETHPLVGQWRADLPKFNCFEEYDVRVDGTRSSQSAQERNESELMISLTPSSKGFYKWTDKITKNNGKPDCTGDTTPLGHVSVNYVRVHPSGSRFLVCEAEDMSTCYIEFVRKSK